MSSNLEIKKQVVADIVEKLKGAESMVVCSYSGLTVEQVTVGDIRAKRTSTRGWAWQNID